MPAQAGIHDLLSHHKQSRGFHTSPGRASPTCRCAQRQSINHPPNDWTRTGTRIAAATQAIKHFQPQMNANERRCSVPLQRSRVILKASPAR
jgi:hypothetical protein